MDGPLVLIGLLLVVGIPTGSLLGLLAWRRVNRLASQVDDLQAQILRLQRQRSDLTVSATAPTPATPKPAMPAAPVAITPTVPTAISTATPVEIVPPIAAPSILTPSPATLPMAAESAPTPASLVREMPPATVIATTDELATPASIAAPPTEPKPKDLPTKPTLPTPPVRANAIAPTKTQPSLHQAAPTSPHRPSATEMETAIGKRWLTWSGIALVFLSAVFLLKYAYDQDWLGRVITPPIRVAGLGLVAVGMVTAGLRLMRQQMPALGHGLAGGGIAIAYLTVYGGFSPALRLTPEPLFGGSVAFGMMALVTAVGMTLAVRANAIALAIAAVLGGFATPVLIDTGGGSREALFTYLLLLDLGVLGAAWFRQWRALDAVAFAGTVVLTFGWFHARESSAASPWPMLVWLLLFHLVFLIIPFALHWRQRTPVAVERFVLAIGNLAYTLAFSAVLLRDKHQLGLALVCLALAGLYASIGILTRLRIPRDGKVGHGFLALGIMLTTLGLFYLLPVEAVATAWIVEAAALLALGYRYQHGPTRFIAHVVMTIGLARLAWKLLSASDLAAPLLWNSSVLAGMAAPLGLAALATIHRIWGDTAENYRQQLGAWWLAGLAAMLLGCAEISRHATGYPQDWQLLPAISAQAGWWTLGGIVVLIFGWRRHCSATAEVAVAPLLAGVLFALASYGLIWPGGIPVLNPRFLILAITLGGLGWWVYRSSKDPLSNRPTLRPVIAAGLHAAVVLGATLETCSWYDRPLENPSGSSSLDEQVTLTLVWAGCALVGLLTSYAGRQRQSAMIAWIPLGLAVLSGFFAYLHGDANQVLAANPRFLALLFAIAIVAGQRLVFTNLTWISSGVHLLATLAGTCELVTWCNNAAMVSEDRSFALSWSLTVLWAVSAGVAGLRRQRGAGSEAFHLALFLAILSAIAALTLFASTWPTALPFVNLRFPAAAISVAVMAWIGQVESRVGEASPGIGWLAVIIGFLAGTCEAPVYFHQTITDPASAHRLAIFSITVVWILMAAVALVVGFRWQRPVVRYLALGLLAVTAVKLLLLDMSGVQQLYRILSFLLVGVALIGASYAYHRLERRLLNPPRADRPIDPD